MTGISDTVQKTLEFIDGVYSFTEYEQTLHEEAKNLYEHFRISIPKVAQSTDGQKLVQKYTLLSSTISTEGTFNDMVKIIWRMVKGMGGSAQYKICLFFLGIGTLHSALHSKGDGRAIDAWITKVGGWLGRQLTIGGKGVAGEGEGSVNDRIQRFFTTPYLHDFD